ncbi:MAG: hypothetical protein V3W18_08680 [candidate division Zixibacteria bacterium]
MKKLIIFLLAISLLLITGCFDYEQTMVLNKDGSGTVTMRYTVDKAYLDQIKQMSKAIAEQSGDNSLLVDPAETMFSKSEIEETLKAHDAGIKMLSYEISETDNARIWDMKFSFADVNKLDILADALSADSEEYKPSEGEEVIYSRQSDGTWLFSQPFMENDPEGEEVDEYGYEDSEDYSSEDYEEEYSEDYDGDDIGNLDIEGAAEAMENWSEEMKDLMQSMANKKIRVTIDFPGNIVESNATSTEGNSATWEYSLEQMQQAPEELRAVIKP